MRTVYRITGQRHRGDKAFAAIAAAKIGDAVTLEREPQNPHDRSAVRVWVGGIFVGFIPSAMTRKGLADHIDANGAPPAERQTGRTLGGKFVIEGGQPSVEIEEV